MIWAAVGGSLFEIFLGSTESRLVTTLLCLYRGLLKKLGDVEGVVDEEHIFVFACRSSPGTRVTYACVKCRRG